MRNVHPFFPGRRRGVSLIELLVVVVIVLLVSAVTMRSLAPALGLRNLREAARMVNVAFNAARNRAILNGRPAGVWIEKRPGLPEAASQVFQVMVPEPYSGDFADSQIEAYCWPDWTLANRRTNQYFVNVVVPSRASIPDLSARNQDAWSVPDPKVQRIVRSGDLLRFNFSGPLYTLYRGDELDPQFSGSATLPVDQTWVIGVFANKIDLTTTATYTGYRYGTSTSVYRLPGFPRHTMGATPFVTPGSYAPQSTMSTGMCGQRLPYQIFRRPQKLSSGTVQLPESTVIDLNYSTVDNVILYPRMTTITTSASGNICEGMPLSNNDQLLGPSDTNYDMRPVVVTFNANGGVDLVYCIRYDSDYAAWKWFGQRLIGQIHLLIGKREKVPANTDLSSVAAQYKNNFADPEVFWVNVTPRTGQITTSPNSSNLGSAQTAANGYGSQMILTTATGIWKGKVNVPSYLLTAQDYGEMGVTMGGK